jgi:adenosylmethionine-8-amino-7-oxononanoate aminotransferase
MTDLVARDLSAVWHPFTQHSLWEEDEPLVIDRAEGMHLIDTDGRRYLDGVSSLWVSVHGHAVPEIDEAVRAQLAKVAHTTFLGLTHEPGVALAERLLELAPQPEPGSDVKPLRKVFYAGDGSSAVEASLKMAYQAATQRGEHRPLFVCVSEGYHGDTLGSVSVGGIETFHAAYRSILLRTRHIPSPYRVGTAASLQSLAELLGREGDQVCAVIIEPMVQAAAGILTHDADFIRGVRTLSQQAGALLIADEVATGIGRTGEMWGVQHAGVVPDLLTVGKGLSGGYLPISAVLATDEVYEAFLGSPESDRTFFHGHTYTANPLACAAALANLKLMTERDTVGHARSVGERLGALLVPLSGMAGVTEVRRIGTMTGIEVASRGSRTGFEICRLARRRGVLLRPLSDVVVLMPPLAIGDEDLDELAAVTVDCVHEVVGE